jgi:hypothetical protein
MSSKSFSYSGVLGFGWNVMKSNFWFFVGMWVVSFFVQFFVSLPGEILKQVMEHCNRKIPPFLALAMIAMVFINFIIGISLCIGSIKITLSFCDNQKPMFSTLFKAWRGCFWRYIGTGLLYALILVVIPMACILPFVLLSRDVISNPFFALPVSLVITILVVILAIKFSLCFYFVIDKGLGPINALKASSMATAGAIDSLAVFSILCCLINMLGVLCFFVGLFATFPTVMVAMALVYRHLSEQTPELAELGIGGPSVKPSASGVGGSTRPFAGMQPNPIIPSIQSIQSGPPAYPKACPSGRGIQLGQGVRLSQGVQPSQHIQPGEGIRPAPAIQRKEEKKNNKSLLFWLAALVILSVAIAAGISYYFLARAKGKVVVFPNGARVSIKEVSLTGIIYSEDNPSAMIDGKIVKEGDIIDGIKVVKINKNDVELEKDGVKWTQRARKATGS